FGVVEDASPSSTGWQGVLPPALAHREIRDLYFRSPNAADLMPHIVRNFQRVPYVRGTSTSAERSTIIVDKNGLIFFYRSTRAMWLQDEIIALEQAQAILLGDELIKPGTEQECAGAERGPHLAIIIGHQRQYAVKPSLTLWHRDHQQQVDDFLRLPIIDRIFRWVTSIVWLIWPGLAARCEAEAVWMEEHHKIKPLFGLFWNFCWNAAFEKQRRIHTAPHVDWKNQVGVCLILTYITSKGLNYNSKRRGWIVLWEAGVYVELPPWTLVGYPSSLFYHFNVDVDQLEIVTTDADVDRPTLENSTPIDDAAGRGSMVWFSQASMRHGPVTGYDTLDSAAAAGVPRTTDYGNDAQAAFSNSG
ncbi:hypothetical protein C8R43DRAFT_853427, partial [Mycena crocata]